MTTLSTGSARRVDYSVRAHITYTVHEYVTGGNSASSRELAKGLDAAQANNLAEMHAKATRGEVNLTTTEATSDVYADDAIPLGLSHAYQDLLQCPKGTKLVLWVVPRIENRLFLRLERLTPVNVPLTPADNPWDGLTVAQMRKAVTAFGQMGWEAAKLLRLHAYQHRDAHLVDVLNRASVAMDVVDPDGFFPDPR